MEPPQDAPATSRQPRIQADLGLLLAWVLKGWFLVFGLVFWLMPGLIASQAIGGSLYRAHQRDQHGIVVHGTVARIACPPVPAGGRGPGSKHRDRYEGWTDEWHEGDILTVRYRDHRDVTHKFKWTGPLPGTKVPRVGGTVVLRYVRSAPEEAIFEADHRPLGAWDFMPLLIPLAWFLGPFVTLLPLFLGYKLLARR